MSWAQLTADAAGALAERHGTPFYFYDLGVLRERALRARKALPATLLYAVKANPNPEVVRSLHGVVQGLDVSSLGEVDLAIRCGWAPEQLSFAGPGKTPFELEQAVARGVLVSVESLRELEAIAAHGVRARVRLRLNPTQRSQAYRVPMIGGPSPFGIDEEELAEAAALLRTRIHPRSSRAEMGLPARSGGPPSTALGQNGDDDPPRGCLEFDGIHVHPGAQCTSVGAFAAAAATTLDLAERLQRVHGLPLRCVNFGGGFGVLGQNEEFDVEAAGARLAAMLTKFRAATGQKLDAVLELGRWLAGPAGIYVARVVSEKRSRGKHFVILDGGLNHHLGATGHLAPEAAPRLPVLNLTRPAGPTVTRTVVGPLCTPLDTFGEVELPEPRVGDLLGIPGSGAYGYSFSPLHFLSHSLPAEVIRS